jgi:hypothetical protein
VLIGIIKCPTSTLISVVSPGKGPKTFVWTFEFLISSGPNVCFKGTRKKQQQKERKKAERRPKQ